MGELHYLRGPAPAALRDELASAEAQRAAVYAGRLAVQVSAEPQPTYYKPMPYGPDHVVNPNVCGICHKSRHRDTPHHDFEAAAASVEYATRAGWPLPTNQEPRR